jgi:putative endonuclease
VYWSVSRGGIVVEAQAYYVYVLWSDAVHKFYVGITDDLDRRVRQHNEGVSRWTRGRGPWRCVWRQRCASLTEARRLENRLKRQKGGQGFYRITGLAAMDFQSSGS